MMAELDPLLTSGALSARAYRGGTPADSQDPYRRAHVFRRLRKPVQSRDGSRAVNASAGYSIGLNGRSHAYDGRLGVKASW